VQLSLLGAVVRSGFVKRYYPVLVAGAESKKCDNLSRFFIEKAVNNLPLLSMLAIAVS